MTRYNGRPTIEISHAVTNQVEFVVGEGPEWGTIHIKIRGGDYEEYMDADAARALAGALIDVVEYIEDREFAD